MRLVSLNFGNLDVVPKGPEETSLFQEEAERQAHPVVSIECGMRSPSQAALGLPFYKSWAYPCTPDPYPQGGILPVGW